MANNKRQKTKLDELDRALANIEKEEKERTAARAADVKRILKDRNFRKRNNTLTAEQMHKIVQRVYEGDKQSINRLLYYVNANSKEANTRLERLKNADLDIYSPTTNLEVYMSSYSLDSLPERGMLIEDKDKKETYLTFTEDEDVGEIVGQAQAIRKFLSSPLSRVQNARDYMKSKVDYMLDPEGRINLEGVLGRKLSPQERGFLGRMLADSPLSDYINEEYAITSEVLEMVIDEFDVNETINSNIARINKKLTSELNIRSLINTRYSQNWERRNKISLKAKGAKDVSERLNLRN